DAPDASMSFTTYGSRFVISSVTSSRGFCTWDTGGCCVSCTFGTLAANDSVRIEIGGVPLDEGGLTGYVNVGSSIPDGDYSNNTIFDGVQVLFSADQRIAALIATVMTYPLHKGAQKALVDRLTAARTAVAAGDTTGACADLNDFRQRVAKLVGHGL